MYFTINFLSGVPIFDRNDPTSTHLKLPAKNFMVEYSNIVVGILWPTVVEICKVILKVVVKINGF